jgi:heme oxygenase
MLSDQLKEYTKTNHRLLEGKIITRIKAIAKTDDYIQLLLIFYTFFGGLELLIDKSLDTSVIADYLHRRKTASLAADLFHLHTSVKPLAAINYLPVIRNNLQSLGALYVIEGSTLGGSIINKMIHDKLKLTANDGFTFFGGYGGQTIPMWQTFKQSINQLLLNAGEETIIIEAANETFLRFSNWVD